MNSSSQDLSVSDLTTGDESDWDDLVIRSSKASPYHLLGWRQVMMETYGYRTHYLAAKTNGELAGVLPLIEIRSRLLGDALSSLPGGVCAEAGDASGEVAAALVEAAKTRAEALGVDYLALRDTFESTAPGLETVNHHAVFVEEMPADSEEVISALPSNMRRQVRQGLSYDLEITAGTEGLRDFYRMFARFTRDVGTPVFSLGFLEQVAEFLEGHWMVVCIREQGRAIGGGFQILLGDTVWGLWGGSLHGYLDQRPNHLLIWKCFCYGAEHGFRYLNFGRSRVGSGQYRFKRQWGGSAYPLYQHFYPLTKSSIPGILDETDPSWTQELFSETWRRLPVPLARWLGPKLRQHIPFG